MSEREDLQTCDWLPGGPAQLHCDALIGRLRRLRHNWLRRLRKNNIHWSIPVLSLLTICS